MPHLFAHVWQGLKELSTPRDRDALDAQQERSSRPLDRLHVPHALSIRYLLKMQQHASAMEDISTMSPRLRMLFRVHVVVREPMHFRTVE